MDSKLQPSQAASAETAWQGKGLPPIKLRNLYKICFSGFEDTSSDVQN